MSDTMLNAKSLHDSGKYVFIIDTMNELLDEDVEKELGDRNFHLWKFNTYEDCKRAILLLLRETPKEMRGNCAILISNVKYITTERTLQMCHEDPSEHLIEVNAETGEEIPVVEVPCNDGFPEPEPLKDTFVISEVTRELFNSRKMLKDLLKTVREARDAGMVVEIVKGLEPVHPLEQYQAMSSNPKDKV